MSFKSSLQGYTYINAPCSNKLKKIHEWTIWSDDNKKTFKLTTYIKEICMKIGNLDTPRVLNNILDITLYVMEKLQNNNGTKRGNVKDGIIAVCIYYACKEISIKSISYTQISKSLDLPMKYITSAEKLVLELINSKQINLDKNLFLSNKSAVDYIIENPLMISDELIQQSIKIINICENNDILLGNSPLSISVGCLFYTLKQINKLDNINIKFLCKIYKISNVTIMKIYNVLLKYDNFINERLKN